MKFAAITLTTLSALALISCAGADSKTDNASYDYNIQTATGDSLGTLKLTDLGDKGTKVAIKLKGLEQGLRAMHFHEFGKCEAPGFTSAGGHYNPTGAAHGMKMEDGPHAGDMMNIMIGADGTGEAEFINDRVSINSNGPLPPLKDADGSALIIHAKADDYKSQPSGAAGPRIGCAVIK